MKTIHQLERLRKIHQYIKACNTGPPSDFANKLSVSESQWYNILEDLKIKGFPISYSRKLKSYLYTDNCELEFNFSVQLLTPSEKIKIIGGKKIAHSNVIRVGESKLLPSKRYSDAHYERFEKLS